MDIADLLAVCVARGASDMHLSAGVEPLLRIDGDLQRCELPSVSAQCVLELIHSPHQAGVSLLDQIQEAHAAITELLGNRDHQPEVVATKLLPGLLVLLAPLGDDRQPASQRLRLLLSAGDQLVERGVTGGDRLSTFNISSTSAYSKL